LGRIPDWNLDLAAAFSQLTDSEGEHCMTKLKFLAAAAALVTFMAGPANARVYHHARHYYHHRYYNPGPIGAAAGIAGAAIGTAGAIATAPFRGSYAYDRGYYGSDPYYRRGW
jgi:nitrate/nitrite transporter NarK